MSRLTSGSAKDRGGGVDETYMEPEYGDGLPYGIVIDGAHYALEGQPPTAVSKGWGDVGWLLLPRSGPFTTLRH